MPGRGVFLCFLSTPRRLPGVLPGPGQAPYETGSPSIDLVTQRMQTLFHLQSHRPTVVITTPHAALQYLVPQSVFAQSCLTVKVGSVIERESLLRHLLRTGYRRVSVVEIPGEFSIRGGIVDIFSTDATEPYRIEFLGDTVESTRRFDPGTQESTESVLSAVLLPAREYLLPPGESDSSLSEIPPDAEWRLPDMYPSMATLLDYFPTSPFVVMDRPFTLAAHAREWEEHDAAGTGVPYPGPSQQSVGWDEFLALLCDGPSLAFDVVAPVEDSWNPVISLPLQSAKSVGLGLRGTSFTDTLAILERLPRERAGYGRGSILRTGRALVGVVRRTPRPCDGTEPLPSSAPSFGTNAVLYSARVSFVRVCGAVVSFHGGHRRRYLRQNFPASAPTQKQDRDLFVLVG